MRWEAGRVKKWDQAVLAKFLLLFSALAVLGQLYPPEGGFLPKLLAFGAFTVLAAALALPCTAQDTSRSSQGG